MPYFLLSLLINWKKYYCNYKETTAYYIPYKCRSVSTTTVDNLWWFQVKNELKVPITNHDFVGTPLGRCWLPDSQALKILGNFLPVIDLAAFPEEYRQEVADFLRDEVKLRQRLEELKLKEWQEILQSLAARYPSDHCQTDGKSRHAVGALYRAFLESEHDPGRLNEVAWLCRKGEGWNYRQDCWLEDQEDVAQAFRKDIWLLLHPGSGLEARAARLPGVRRLSQHSQVEVLPGEENEAQSQEIKQNLQKVLPLIYVWLRDQAKLEEKDKGKLQSFTIKVVASLKLRVGLTELGERIIEKNWAIEDNTIFLSSDTIQNQTWWSDVSQGLANLLNRKADQEFYENFFRCQNDDERRAKLRKKGVRDENIAMFLEEYKGAEPVQASGNSIRFSGQQEQQNKTFVRRETETAAISTSGSLTPDNQQSRTVSLINPQTITFRETLPETGAQIPSGRGDGFSGSRQDDGTSRLTQEQRREMERVSRLICRHKVEADGYQVEEMPEDNPGFDLKASKEGKTRLIEVKGNVGSAYKVEITLRQFEACFNPQKYGGDAWELWNVENLSRESKLPHRARVYKTLLLDNVQAKTFHYDLQGVKAEEVWELIVEE